MIVKELIKRLSDLPQSLEVVIGNTDGCRECNEWGESSYHGVYSVKAATYKGYPFYNREKVVIE